MKHKFTINGLDCPNCAAKLASMIEADEQVASCKINFLTEKITVECELDGEAALSLVRCYGAKFSKSVVIE